MLIIPKADIISGKVDPSNVRAISIRGHTATIPIESLVVSRDTQGNVLYIYAVERLSPDQQGKGGPRRYEEGEIRLYHS